MLSSSRLSASAVIFSPVSDEVTSSISPARRIEARTHGENTAEQKSLVKAGFQLEGVVRAGEFRDGQWRDGQIFGGHLQKPTIDPSPLRLTQLISCESCS